MLGVALQLPRSTSCPACPCPVQCARRVVERTPLVVQAAQSPRSHANVPLAGRPGQTASARTVPSLVRSMHLASRPRSIQVRRGIAPLRSRSVGVDRDRTQTLVRAPAGTVAVGQPRADHGGELAGVVPASYYPASLLQPDTA